MIFLKLWTFSEAPEQMFQNSTVDDETRGELEQNSKMPFVLFPSPTTFTALFNGFLFRPSCSRERMMNVGLADSKIGRVRVLQNFS